MMLGRAEPGKPLPSPWKAARGDYAVPGPSLLVRARCGHPDSATAPPKAAIRSHDGAMTAVI